MAILDPLYGTPLAVQLIPQVDRNFAEHLKLRGDQRSIGLLSVDNDDATYTAIDEATKAFIRQHLLMCNERSLSPCAHLDLIGDGVAPADLEGGEGEAVGNFLDTHPGKGY